MDWEYLESHNTVARQLRAMEQRANQVAAGYKRAAFLFGPPGVGKSHTIREALILFKMRGHEPVECHPARYQDLLSAYEEAAGVRPLVLEEADVVWRSERMLNILKIALDPERPRSQRAYQGVDISAPVFLTTNVDLGDLHSASRGLQVHGPALFRRVPPRGVSASTYELWEFSVLLALRHGLIDKEETEVWGDRRQQPRPLSVRAAALRWFSEQRDNLTSVSPGALRQVAEAFDCRNADDRTIELETLLISTHRRSPPQRSDLDWAAEIVGASAKTGAAA